jgi:serine/threonine protein phosphatase PrpC
MKGNRSTNEDVIVIKKMKSSGEILAGVFDGHGGSFVSSYLGKHVFKALSNKYSVEEIRRTVKKFHSRLSEQYPKEVAECGSTLLVSRFVPETRTLQIIHLGDTRAVLRTQQGVKTLTEDHKPDTVKERYRISQAGHKIEWDREDRVYRINGYSVSRAIGDTVAPGISQECEIRVTKWTSNCKYLIMACDGVWDVMSSEDACAVVDAHATNFEEFQTNRSKKNIAYILAKEAHNRGSQDNISVLVLYF